MLDSAQLSDIKRFLLSFQYVNSLITPWACVYCTSVIRALQHAVQNKQEVMFLIYPSSLSNPAADVSAEYWRAIQLIWMEYFSHYSRVLFIIWSTVLLFNHNCILGGKKQQTLMNEFWSVMVTLSQNNLEQRFTLSHFLLHRC